MSENLDQMLLEAEKGFPRYVKEYSKRISSSTSKKTNIAYLNDIKTFFEYCSVSIFNKDISDITLSDLESITDIDIYDYLSYLGKYEKTFKNKAGHDVTMIFTNSESGKSRKLAAIKSLYKKLYDTKMIKNNPTLTVIQSTPAYIGIRERLTKDEVLALEKTVLEGLNIKTDLLEKAYERNKMRDTAIMLIFLYSGIRVSELAGLNIDDIDIPNSTINIIRKGQKRDKIPYPHVLADYLNDYLKFRKNMKDIHTTALFVSQFKERITSRSINNIIKKYAARANITKKVTPHTLRRTYLTHLYNKTKDISTLQRAAGHRNVSTTLKFYASVTEEEYINQLNNFSY